MGKIEGIVCHWTVSGPNTTRADVDRWHKEKGMARIGYHRIIEHESVNKNTTRAMDLVKTGRFINDNKTLEPNEYGAHTLGFNRSYIGIAVVGSPKQPPSALQLACLRQTLLIMTRRHGLSPKNVWAHRHMKSHENNQCPGPDVLAVVMAFRAGG